MELLITFILAAVGVTVTIVWPVSGPGAWVREHVLRRVLGKKASGALDCYVCSGFWAGSLLSPGWWAMGAGPWVWSGGWMVAAVFWVIVARDGEQHHETRNRAERSSAIED